LVTGDASLEMNEMNTPDKSWVLITGASSGFGEEFARQYAEQGHSLVLVARRLDRLQRLAEALRQEFRIDVVVERVDLSEVAAVSQFHQRLRERGIAIDILINNAGHGLQGPFLDGQLDAALGMVQLDVASLTAVTHVFAQDMRTRERSADVGQRVQKGQPLVRLDPEDLSLSAAAQQANVEAARAKYTQAKADETRSAMLVKSGVISRREYDQDRAALDSAKALLEAVEAQARVSENSSEYAVLLADADGVIVRTLSEPGQVVAAGQTVIQLAHDGPREALINLPEGVRPDLGTIAAARLYGQDQMYQARLRQLSDAADPASRTFEARYVLEGEAASAPLGSTVTITLLTKPTSGNQSVLVPVGAVYDRGSGPGVWIVDDKSEVKFRFIKIASIGQEEVVVFPRSRFR
jgi:RND family efflux transporter MFP subunit